MKSTFEATEAPYPRNEDEVTAAALLRHLTVAAQVAWAMQWETFEKYYDAAKDPALRDLWMASISLSVSDFTGVFLLRALIEHAPIAVADQVARDLWLVWEDGGAVGEWLWEYLDEYGINGDEITEAVTAAVK